MYTRVFGWFLATVPMVAQSTMGPYTASCSANPVAEVPTFSSLAVTLQPDVVEEIARQCSQDLFAAEDAFVNLFLATNNDDRSASGTQLKKSIEALRAASQSGEAAATFLARCAEKTAWTVFVRSLPQPFQDAESLYKTATGLQKEANEYLKKFEEKEANGQSVGYDDYQRAEALLKSAESSLGAPMKKMGNLMRTLGEFARTPEMALPDTSEMDARMAKASTAITSMTANCRVSTAEEELRSTVERGQSMLLRARLTLARATKIERSYREDLDLAVPGWQNNPERVARGELPGPYEKWFGANTMMKNAQVNQAYIEKRLAESGQLCTQLQRGVNDVYQRRNAFSLLQSRADRAIQACELPGVSAIIDQVRREEASACGPFLQDAPPMDDPILGSSPFVPTGQVLTSAAPFSQPSVRLSTKLSAAERSCVQTTSKAPDAGRVSLEGTEWNLGFATVAIRGGAVIWTDREQRNPRREGFSGPDGKPIPNTAWEPARFTGSLQGNTLHVDIVYPPQKYPPGTVGAASGKYWSSGSNSSCTYEFDSASPVSLKGTCTGQGSDFGPGETSIVAMPPVTNQVGANCTQCPKPGSSGPESPSVSRAPAQAPKPPAPTNEVPSILGNGKPR